MITKELTNRVGILYNGNKDVVIDNSYSYVSSQIRKKTSRLIDNFQSGLIDEVDRKDLTDILRINDTFKEFALEKPEERIISTDLHKVNYFLNIIQKYPN